MKIPLRYRCVYCRKELHSYYELQAHEPWCEAKATMRRIWQMAIDRAREKEASQ